MDNVKAVTRWQDGAGAIFETEDEALQSEARRVVRNIICDSICWEKRTIDVEAIADRRTAFIDALRKVERGKLTVEIMHPVNFRGARR